MNPLNTGITDPEFFGKDSFVPFLGQVEDVNDPKQSGRVKVRIIGWHPKDKKELSTDGLPWARVGMPNTHAQIGRVGGKHGLLPGSWVMGCFLDGHYAQKPMCLCSFNASSNATDETNTHIPKGKAGKLDDEEDGPFTKKTGPQAINNKAQRLKDETGENSNALPSSEVDVSGDNTTHNALNPCLGDNKDHQSVADYNNTEAENTADNPTSYIYNVALADGKCGATSHAIERIQIILQEIFPSSEIRFAFNDSVYSGVSGQRIDLNAIINFASILICDILKDSIENLRGLINDILLRPTRSTAILASTTREFSTVKVADLTSKAAIDVANKVYTEIIENLCMFINDLLRAINNQQQPGPGVSPFTNIANASAECVATTIIGNVLTLASAGASGSLGTLLATLDNPSLNNIEDILGQIAPGLEIIDQIADVISFITEFKFTVNPLIFNTLSLLTLDIFNRDGCNDDGSFDTSIGVLQSLGFNNTGFGGLPVEVNTGEAEVAVCSEALGEDLFFDIGTGKPGVPTPTLIAPGAIGCRADVISVSVPSSEPEAAQNFISGIANTVVIKNPGCLFFTETRGDQILFDISSLSQS